MPLPATTQNRAAITGQWATPSKLCGMCHESNPASEFVRYKGRHSGTICRTCWHTRREEAVERFEADAGPTEAQRKLRNNVIQALTRRRFQKRGVINGMSPDEYATKLAKVPDRIAAIVGKTYAHQGDAAKLADDEALMMIRDLLIELDETLLPRNENKRLLRR